VCFAAPLLPPPIFLENISKLPKKPHINPLQNWIAALKNRLGSVMASDEACFQISCFSVLWGAECFMLYIEA
jgi:hypothetical protein